MENIYLLPDVQKGDFMYWNCISQTYYNGILTIKDDTCVYATIEKTDRKSSLQTLGAGSALYEGGANLRVELSMPECTDLKCAGVTSDTLAPSGKVVGQTSSLCYEDSTNDDFNDFYLNIVSWHHAG